MAQILRGGEEWISACPEWQRCIQTGLTQRCSDAEGEFIEWNAIVLCRE